jgi:hypothetical protein
MVPIKGDVIFLQLSAWEVCIQSLLRQLAGLFKA